MKKKTWTAALTLIFLLALAAMPRAASALTALEKLGRSLYNDKNLSRYENQSCKSCHHPNAGFADISNLRNPAKNVVSTGSDGFSLGGRNAPTAAYAGFSPKLHQITGTWIGGLFWDGRASGNAQTATSDPEAGPTYDPLADQAKGPFLNPVEMDMINKQAVVNVAASATYASLFAMAFPGAVDFSNIGQTYNQIATAIAAYERSVELLKFSSKFDRFYAACKKADIDTATIGVEVALNNPKIPTDILTATELRGLALFNQPNNNDNIRDPGEGGNCAACHVSGASEFDPGGRAIFTDFTYDNLGIPANPLLASVWGGKQDLGLGDVLEGFYGGDYSSLYGHFKVSTLRNIAVTPPYGHNGFFTTLEQIVHFYNTAAVGTWAPPEVPQTVNRSELGNLGLTAAEEGQIVAFLRTLTDQ